MQLEKTLFMNICSAFLNNNFILHSTTIYLCYITLTCYIMTTFMVLWHVVFWKTDATLMWTWIANLVKEKEVSFWQMEAIKCVRNLISANKKKCEVNIQNWWCQHFNKWKFHISIICRIPLRSRISPAKKS